MFLFLRINVECLEKLILISNGKKCLLVCESVGHTSLDVSIIYPKMKAGSSVSATTEV